MTKISRARSRRGVDLEELNARIAAGHNARRLVQAGRGPANLIRRSSRLLDGIAKLAGLPSPAWLGEPRVVRVPQVFSFIDEPEEALDAILRFVRFARDGARVIRVDQSECRSLELCAASVLNALASDASYRLKTGFEGAWPRTPLAREIVGATGLPRVLGVELPDFPAIDNFPLSHGGTERRSLQLPSKKERTTHALARYVERWFARHGFAFTKAGMSRVGKLVGEVLANAEEHSEIGTWWAAGYLREPAANRAERIGDCHLTFFSFGQTLAGSLQRSLAPNSPLRERIEELVLKHVKRRLFDTSTWTPDELWTLYALQDGVSRKRDEDATRGFGTADMIEMFQELGRTRAGDVAPRMCVYSGHTHILFNNDRYRLRPVGVGPDPSRRVIAFNEENDLEQRPDSRSVRRLRRAFPGTLISLRFYLDRAYLEAIGKTE